MKPGASKMDQLRALREAKAARLEKDVAIALRTQVVTKGRKRPVTKVPAKGKMGRPPVHGSAAARQAAYRARLNAKFKAIQDAINEMMMVKA